MYIASQLIRKHLRMVKLFGVLLTSKQLFFVSISEARRIGHARAYQQYESLFACVCVDVNRQFRPWSDQAHFAAQNVPKLGKLVEFVTSEESTNRRHSTVA